MGSCGEEDRVLKVTCEATAGRSITADFGEYYAGSTSVGVLNTFDFVAGKIIELKPSEGATGRGSGAVAYVLRTRSEDFLPVRRQPLLGKLSRVELSIWPEKDVRESVAALKQNLLRQVADNTSIALYSAKLQVLQDPLRLINSDVRAVDTIKAASETSRFAVVSAVSFSDDVTLYYSDDVIAVNTFKVGRYYLHAKYACSAVTDVNLKSKSTGGTAPVLFFYLPISYDAASGLVRADARPIDLADFELSASPATAFQY